MAKRNITLHDKYKSTTALYPKIDASSFTPGAIEKVAEISKDEIEDNIVPNETPVGTPTELHYITIGGTEYYIKEGTLVIANPTLAGTENDLTGIQIGDIKYKIPSSSGTHLYQHNCILYGNFVDSGYPGYVFITIFNDRSTAMVKNDLKDFLVARGFDGSSFSKVYNNVEVYCDYSGINSTSVKGIAWTGTYYCSLQYPSATPRNWYSTQFTDTVIDLGEVSVGGTPLTQVQANWNETDTNSPAYIQNKPTIPQEPIEVGLRPNLENDTVELNTLVDNGGIFIFTCEGLRQDGTTKYYSSGTIMITNLNSDCHTIDSSAGNYGTIQVYYSGTGKRLHCSQGDSGITLSDIKFTKVMCIYKW